MKEITYERVGTTEQMQRLLVMLVLVFAAMTAGGATLLYPRGVTGGGPAELSIARLLDDVRVMLVSAWDEDRIPTTLVMNDRLFRVVLEGKRREIETGRPITLLGLDLEGDPGTPLERPVLR